MAAHVTNFNQTNIKIILDLINEQNAATLTTPLVAADIDFSAVAQIEAGPDVNLTITGNAARGFKGSVELTYNRVNLSFMNPTVSDDLYLEVVAQTQVSELLPQLNTAFGLALTAADIVDGAIPAADPEGVPVGFNIVAAADSLVWTGQVRVMRVAELTDLTTEVATTTLDGLYAPA